MTKKAQYGRFKILFPNYEDTSCLDNQSKIMHLPILPYCRLIDRLQLLKYLEQKTLMKRAPFQEKLLKKNVCEPNMKVKPRTLYPKRLIAFTSDD